VTTVTRCSELGSRKDFPTSEGRQERTTNAGGVRGSIGPLATSAQSVLTGARTVRRLTDANAVRRTLLFASGAPVQCHSAVTVRATRATCICSGQS